MLDYEINNLNIDSIICGIDEAGRGPLAGPVVACACIPDFRKIIPEINDSKKLSESKRNQLYIEIVNSCLYYKTVFISNDEIDRINILEATKVEMSETLTDIFPKPDVVLIDAVKLDIPYNSISLIKGDMISYAIACASIIAKVERDKYMYDLAKKYPQYLFQKHKGYGTKKHIEALKAYGPCEEHRRSFIKNFID